MVIFWYESFDFNRWSRIPWVSLFVSRARQKTFDMVPYDTPIILDISLWESPQSESGIMFSMITGPILVGIINNLVWGGNLHTAITHSWIWSTQMRHTAFGTIGEIITPNKKANWDWTELMVVRGSRDVFCILYIYMLHITEIQIDFHQLWGDTVVLVIPFNWRPVYIRADVWCNYMKY